MPFTYKRSITFTIPGAHNSPSVQITATENSGAINFVAEVLATDLQTADLRGLFFNFNDDLKLEGLKYLGNDVTRFLTANVIDLGNGVNMHGAAAPFDVGLRFGTPGNSKDKIQSTSFVLSNTNNNLTLGDIANVNFGARLTGVGEKLTVIAPAAPDAIDDIYEIFEDGQAGLHSPSHIPVGIKFDILLNDTDADDNTLTVIDVRGALHGQVLIIDGDDEDTLIGDAVLYTPDIDYSGKDSFEYLISDNNGGTDFAFVDIDIKAVADIPGLEVTTRATENVNEIIYTVKGIQQDADFSEFISNITATGGSGVTISDYTPLTALTLGNAFHEFLVTLPYAQDLDSSITFEITSTEISNNDTETYSESFNIKTFYEEYTQIAILEQTVNNFANYTPHTSFDGVDEGEELSKDLGGGVMARLEAGIIAGIDTEYTFESGNLVVESRHETGINNYYNQVTDILQIDTSSEQLSASWNIVDAFFSAIIEANFDLTVFAGLDTSIGNFNLLDLLASTVFPPLVIANNLDIKDFQFGVLDPRYVEDIPFYGYIDLNENGVKDSNESRGLNMLGEIEEFGTEQKLPWKADFLSATYRPLDDGHYAGISGETVTEEIEILDYTFDIDEFIWNIVETFVNPIDAALGPTATTAQKLSAKATATASQLNLNPLNFEFTSPFVGPYFDIELIDFDLGANYFVERESSLLVAPLTGILEFEDGSVETFNLGDSFQVDNATDIDVGGNNNGRLDYDIFVTTTAQFNHKMTLDEGGFFEVNALKLSGGLTLNDPTGIVDEIVSWFTDDEFTAAIKIPFGSFDGIELVNETFARVQIAELGESQTTLVGMNEFYDLGVQLV